MESPNVDIRCDLELKQIPLHDNHALRIKGIHVLNHLSGEAGLAILQESFRVLDHGGNLYLMLGDLEFVASRILEDGLIDPWLNCLYHDKAITEAGFHRWGYSFESIKPILEEIGFTQIDYLGPYNAWEFKMIAWKE